MCTFRGGVTTEYKTMRRAVEALFHRFPSIKDDVTQAKQNTQPLITKIRKVRNNRIPILIPMYARVPANSDTCWSQVMKGAHAARNADANSIRRDIFILSHDDAEKRGWSMPANIEKTSCGIKSECTARFLLPFAERDKYLKDPET